MDHYRNTVARETNVKLDPIGSDPERLAKRRYGIFRRYRRRTPMPNNQHPLFICAICAFLWRVLLEVDDALERDIERTVISLDSASHRNMSRVVGNED